MPNIDEPHKLSLIAILVIFAPNGGRPCDGNKEPKVEVSLKLLLVHLYGAFLCLTWRSKNIRCLLSLLPLSSSVLKIVFFGREGKVFLLLAEKWFELCKRLKGQQFDILRMINWFCDQPTWNQTWKWKRLKWESVVFFWKSWQSRWHWNPFSFSFIFNVRSLTLWHSVFINYWRCNFSLIPI